MFTGLISDIGEVTSAEGDPDRLMRFEIASGYDPATIAIGASIACAGVCLTVVAVKPATRGAAFVIEAAAETLSRTRVRHWTVGTHINLERSLKVGDELGGHIVTGHVDGICEVMARDDVDAGDQPWGASARFTLRASRELARFVATKGSVALDGTSLTVNTVDGDLFSVLLIPHSLTVTTWGQVRAGDRLHIEVDMMARYAARLAEARAQGY